MDLLKYTNGQCDLMDTWFVQYFGIYNDEN